MLFKSFLPREFLEEYISCYWALEGETTGTDPIKILPYGNIEIIYNLGDPFETKFGNGPRKVINKNAVVGQRKQYFRFYPSGRVKLFAIRLNPKRAYHFFNCCLSKITNKFARIDYGGSQIFAEIDHVVRDSFTHHERARKISNILMLLTASFNNHDKQLEEAVDHLCRVKNSSINGLCQALGISERTLQRKFYDKIGLSPKMLMRIIRFQNAFKDINRQNLSLTKIALDGSYYDQAHFIKDFKFFTGETPVHFLKEASFFSSNAVQSQAR